MSDVSVYLWKILLQMSVEIEVVFRGPPSIGIKTILQTSYLVYIVMLNVIEALLKRRNSII